jgi:hypothetical protein
LKVNASDADANGDARGRNEQEFPFRIPAELPFQFADTRKLASTAKRDLSETFWLTPCGDYKNAE